MRLIWGRILASLAKDLPRRTFSKWHILDDTIRLVSASQGRQSSFQVFPSFFHALHSNGTRMANSCLHEADPLLFLKLKHSSGVLMENLITVLNSARSCKAQTPYWMLTIKHAAMLRFSLPFRHSWASEKELQQDQCICTDNTGSRLVLFQWTCASHYSPSQDTKCLEWWPEVKAPLLWHSSAAVRLCNLHHLGWQDSYGDIAS